MVIGRTKQKGASGSPAPEVEVLGQSSALQETAQQIEQLMVKIDGIDTALVTGKARIEEITAQIGASTSPGDHPSLRDERAQLRDAIGEDLPARRRHLVAQLPDLVNALQRGVYNSATAVASGYRKDTEAMERKIAELQQERQAILDQAARHATMATTASQLMELVRDNPAERLPSILKRGNWPLLSYKPQ